MQINNSNGLSHNASNAYGSVSNLDVYQLIERLYHLEDKVFRHEATMYELSKICNQCNTAEQPSLAVGLKVIEKIREAVKSYEFVDPVSGASMVQALSLYEALDMIKEVIERGRY